MRARRSRSGSGSRRLIVPIAVVLYILDQRAREPRRLALEQHLARLDDARRAVAVPGRDLEPTVAQDLQRGRRLAVDGDPPAAEEVAGADLAVQVGEPAVAPAVVDALEAEEERAEERARGRASAR